MQDAINKLKALPPLTQEVCGTCRFYRRKHPSTLSDCLAMSRYADMAWRLQCHGRFWQPREPIMRRLKRWLVG